MPQKYEREIEEILKKMDHGPSPTGRAVLTPLPPLERPAPRGPRLGWRAPRVSVNASSLFMLALCLAIVTYPLQMIYQPAVAVAGVLAAALLVLGVMASVVKSARGGPSRTWRGQPLDYGRGGFGTSAIARRWRRWKAHRRFRDPRWN